MGVSQALLKKIAESKSTAGGNDIRDGKYVFLVKKASIEQKFKGTTFISEFDVKESEGVRPDVEPNKVGTDCRMTLNLDTNIMAGGNLKAFACGLVGLDEAVTSTEKLMAEIERLFDKGEAVGMLVICSTYRKIIKTGANAGKEGVFPRWSAVSTEDGNDKASIAKRRAEILKK